VAHLRNLSGRSMRLRQSAAAACNISYNVLSDIAYSSHVLARRIRGEISQVAISKKRSKQALHLKGLAARCRRNIFAAAPAMETDRKSNSVKSRRRGREAARAYLREIASRRRLRFRVTRAPQHLSCLQQRAIFARSAWRGAAITLSHFCCRLPRATTLSHSLTRLRAALARSAIRR